MAAVCGCPQARAGEGLSLAHALRVGTPNPLGEAYVRPVFITQDRKPKAQGAWVGIKCRGGNETSGVRADHRGCSRGAEHLTMVGTRLLERRVLRRGGPATPGSKLIF